MSNTEFEREPTDAVLQDKSVEAARVTDEELTASLAAAEDENGIDQRLAAMTAAMTDQEREQAQASIQLWIDIARRSRENEHVAPDNV